MERHESYVISVLPPFIYWTFWLNTPSLSLRDESVIFTKFCGIYKNKACINACEVPVIRLIRGRENTKWSTPRCRKTKLYLNPMWPLFATNIAQYEKKSHHWASCHINYTHGPIIHENAFLVISKNAVFVRFVKQQMQKRHLVVFNFPVHWPSVFFFFPLSDGMKAQTKNLLHWSSEISLGGEKSKKKKKKHRGFFFFF